MSISEAMLAIMDEFSWGESVYLREMNAVTSGNAALHTQPVSTVKQDHPISPRPAFSRIQNKDIILTNTGNRVGNYLVTIFFRDPINEALVKKCSGVVIGGTYSATTHIVTAGRFMPFVPGTLQLMYLDGNTAGGVRIECAYDGGV